MFGEIWEKNILKIWAVLQFQEHLWIFMYTLHTSTIDQRSHESMKKAMPEKKTVVNNYPDFISFYFTNW